MISLINVAQQTVGVVGWFTGGGHGPLSSDYGMGADNVLEATLVLPSGEVVTANACQYQDLFYAVRGGGGGTFGTIISAVVKAHPTPQTGHHMFFMTTKGTNVTNQFYDIAAFILSEFPRLKDGGMQGYFGFRARGNGASRVLSMNWGNYIYNKPNGTIEKLFEPIKQRLDKENASVSYFTRISSEPTFFKQLAKAPGAEPVALGGGGAMGGWLLPRSALKNVTRLANVLQTIGPSVDGPAVCTIPQRHSSSMTDREIH
jgi:hypothetical protein